MAVLLGVLAAFSWSLHDLLARSLAARVGPFRMAALVMISGGILLTGFVVYNSSIGQAPRAAVIEALLLGLAYGFGVSGLFKAFSLGPISLVAPITASYPILVVLWGVANGLLPTPLQWTAVAATLIGAIVVGRSGTVDGGINAVAPGKLTTLILFCLLSALGYSCSIVLGQTAAVSAGEIEVTWLSRATALVSILPFVIGEVRPARLELRHWAGIFTMGALDVAGVVAINASGHLPAKEFAAVGISAYGAIAVILAMLVLKEKVSGGQWLGIGLIAGGVATLSLSQ